MKVGFGTAHRKHDLNCLCPKKAKHFHLKKCPSINKFLNKYKDSDDINDDGLINREGMDLDKETFLCCCRDNMYEHNEALKFRLIPKDPNDKCDFPIFKKEEGALIDKTDSCMLVPFNKVRLFGRNIEI